MAVRPRKRRSLRFLAVGVATVGAALVLLVEPERRRAARAWVAGQARRVFGSESEWTPSDELEAASEQPAYDPVPEEMSPLEPEPQSEDELVVAPAYGDLSIEIEAPVPVETTVTAAYGLSTVRERAGEPAVHYLRGEPSPPARIVAYDVEGRTESPAVAPSPVEVVARPGAPEQPAPAVGSGMPLRGLAAVAAVAACAAAGLGVWAVLEADAAETDRDATARASQTQVERQARAIALLSQPDARRLPVQGSNGTLVLVVGKNGDAMLIMSRVPTAPRGKIYQAWVIEGKRISGVGLFAGGADHVVLPLGRTVPKGATVAVTLEPAGGSTGPTQQPIFFAKRAA